MVGDSENDMKAGEAAGCKSFCNVIIANRWSDELADVDDKIYTRDSLKRD